MVSQEGCAVAMAPSPSYLPTAFPKSVHSRATHDGTIHYPTTHYQLNRKIVNSQLPSTHYHLHLYTSTRLRPFPTTARAPSPRTGGRNKCDPPVAASGRRGLRPSRGGQRSQRTATLPRHVAMAPSPSYLPTALPKSGHSRATHDGEGAVATANPQMQSKIGNRKFPTINYQLPSTHYHLHLYTSTRLRPFPTTARAPSPRTGGRNKCDPPVAASGRRGLRPSRGGQRSQRTATLPRHVAMAPSPSYLPTALPKSVNFRATHDGEGVVATALSTTQLPTIN